MRPNSSIRSEEPAGTPRHPALKNLLGIILLVGIAAYSALALLCRFVTDRIDDNFNQQYATAWATNPNIAPPGDCGTGLPCTGVVGINPQAALPVGTTFRLGDFTVTVLESGRAPAEEGGAGVQPGQILWRIDYRLEYVADQGAHYGGPVHESQLQSETLEYELQSVEPHAEGGVLELSPGKTITGNVTYVVPDDASALYWVYVNRMESDGVLFRVR